MTAIKIIPSFIKIRFFGIIEFFEASLVADKCWLPNELKDVKFFKETPIKGNRILSKEQEVHESDNFI